MIMQIVINIPKEAYEIIKKDTESEMYIIQVIKQGIPLDDIKNEIERKANSGQWCDAYGAGLIKAIYIIDKHIRERGEE